MRARASGLAIGLATALSGAAVCSGAVVAATANSPVATAGPHPVAKPAYHSTTAHVTKSAKDPGNEFISPALGPRIGIVPEDLLAKRLTLPVPAIRAEKLQPHFYDARGERGHEAIDILAPRGEPVVAAEDGKIVKLFLSKPGGNTIYELDPTQTYAYYYAHLDHYVDGLKEGDAVKRGQIIGYVGSTGNADPSTPHLHFAIFKLGPEKHWWKGEALDPYPALLQ